MRRNPSRRQALLLQHPLHEAEAVKPRGIEGRSEEPRRILGIADASRRQSQVLKLREPSRHGRPLAKTWRGMKEGASLTGHRIFVPAADIECSFGRIACER